MFDAHYDLLTDLYISYLRNDFSRVDEFCKFFNTNNVCGLIANLCFLSDEEMKEEFHENYWNKNSSLVDMFRIATSLSKERLSSSVQVYYSIEGCDKVCLDDLQTLYDLGLRVVAPVWNETNIYGSGIRGQGGLTELGKVFIQVLIDIGIAIDLSHANEETFFDILNEIEKAKGMGKCPVFFASHSNVRRLCNRPRNLTDEQIISLVNAGGKIGIFSNANFVYKNAIKENIRKEKLKCDYIEHINAVISLTNNVDSIILSTDDMTWEAFYTNDMDYKKLSIFPYHRIKEELNQLFLQNQFDPSLIYKIMYDNLNQTLSLLNRLES